VQAAQALEPAALIALLLLKPSGKVGRLLSHDTCSRHHTRLDKFEEFNQGGGAAQ
jgi:hypothetical protein